MADHTRLQHYPIRVDLAFPDGDYAPIEVLIDSALLRQIFEYNYSYLRDAVVWEMDDEDHKTLVCADCASPFGFPLTMVSAGSILAEFPRYCPTCSAYRTAQPTRDRPMYRKAPIAPDLRWTVWERDNFTCCHCGGRRDLTIDHIVPESKGGPAALDNFQTLCRSCNSRKGAR